MSECREGENKMSCNCSYSCGKKGMCCECLRYHWDMGQVPACFFPDDIEKTYDRSMENFIRTYKDRGRWW